VAPTTSFSMAACAANSTIDLATSWSSSTTSLQCIYVQGSTRIITFTQQVWRTLSSSRSMRTYVFPGAEAAEREEEVLHLRVRRLLVPGGVLHPSCTRTPPSVRTRSSPATSTKKKKARDGMRHGSFA
jgi:hypothetical protein